MAWYWSDDAARAAIDEGLASRSSVSEWIQRPVAFADEPGFGPLEIAERHLGVAPKERVGAA